MLCVAPSLPCPSPPNRQMPGRRRESTADERGKRKGRDEAQPPERGCGTEGGDGTRPERASAGARPGEPASWPAPNGRQALDGRGNRGRGRSASLPTRRSRVRDDPDHGFVRSVTVRVTELSSSAPRH